MRTPKQLLAGLARADADFDQALANHGRHEDQFGRAVTRADSQRAMLALAGSWAEVGTAALRVGEAMEACVEDLILSDAEEAA